MKSGENLEVFPLNAEIRQGAYYHHGHFCQARKANKKCKFFQKRKIKLSLPRRCDYSSKQLMVFNNSKKKVFVEKNHKSLKTL